MVEAVAPTQLLIPSHVPREHPVVTREYSLFTPPINEMVNSIATGFDDQVDGATIYGPSRFGKSNAVDQLAPTAFVRTPWRIHSDGHMEPH